MCLSGACQIIYLKYLIYLIYISQISHIYLTLAQHLTGPALVRCVLEWSVPDVCDWLDSLFMPEYKVSPTSAISMLLLLSACLSLRYRHAPYTVSISMLFSMPEYKVYPYFCYQHAPSAISMLLVLSAISMLLLLLACPMFSCQSTRPLHCAL